MQVWKKDKLQQINVLNFVVRDHTKDLRGKTAIYDGLKN